jgi:hypothetical protein
LTRCGAFFQGSPRLLGEENFVKKYELPKSAMARDDHGGDDGAGQHFSFTRRRMEPDRLPVWLNDRVNNYHSAGSYRKMIKK